MCSCDVQPGYAFIFEVYKEATDRINIGGYGVTARYSDYLNKLLFYSKNIKLAWAILLLAL